MSLLYAEAWKTCPHEMDDRAGIGGLMADMQFFDVRNVQEDVESMASEMWEKRAASIELSRMPAPTMWCEFPGGAMVLLRIDMPNGCQSAQLIAVHGTRSDYVGNIALGEGVLQDLNAIIDKSNSITLAQIDTEFRLHALALLALINERTIADVSHRKAPRQQRRACHRQNRSVPIESWSEVTLKLRRPTREGHAGSASGVMPRHLVLGHERRVHGVKRWIDAYWRGDEANGVRHHVYKIAA